MKLMNRPQAPGRRAPAGRSLRGLRIPTVDVSLVHAGRRVRVAAGVDSGLEGFDVLVSRARARELDVAVTGRRVVAIATGEDLVVGTGEIDRVEVAGKPACALSIAQAGILDETETYIGPSFMQAVGMTVEYGAGGPSVRCTGAQPRLDHHPVFPIYLVHRGRIMDVDAVFDTGFEGMVAVPEDAVDALGLVREGEIDIRHHGGITTVPFTSLDRVGMKAVPQCWASQVAPVPIQSPRLAVVGEGFLRTVNGIVGYDLQGAYFTCEAAPTVVRAKGVARAAQGVVEGFAMPLWGRIAITAGLAAGAGLLIWKYS